MAAGVRPAPGAVRMQDGTPIEPVPNGSFASLVEGQYRGLCDKGPWHGKWITAEHFRFTLARDGTVVGRYVYQFGIWIWQGR